MPPVGGPVANRLEAGCIGRQQNSPEAGGPPTRRFGRKARVWPVIRDASPRQPFMCIAFEFRPQDDSHHGGGELQVQRHDSASIRRDTLPWPIP